jgi:hypothetical protein
MGSSGAEPPSPVQNFNKPPLRILHTAVLVVRRNRSVVAPRTCRIDSTMAEDRST